VQVWESGGEKPKQVLRGHTAAVTALAFLPDGRRLVSAAFGWGFIEAAAGRHLELFGEVILWDLAAGRPLHRVAPGVGAVGLAHAGRRLAALGPDNHVHLWDLESRQELFTRPLPAGVPKAVGLSPDGARLAVAAAKMAELLNDFASTVQVWDVAG